MRLTAKKKALMAQVEVNATLAAENSFLKKKLLQRKSILADVSIYLQKMAECNIELLEEKIELKKKLTAANTFICEHVAEKATLENLAAENAGLAEECNALQKQLTAIKETLRKYIAFSARKQYQAGAVVWHVHHDKVWCGCVFTARPDYL